jgi:hypothetical protein
MEKYWQSFVESSTFQQFLDFRGKYDDSYYKRFKDILTARAQGQYHIYDSDNLQKFEVKRAIAPRKMMKLLKFDQSQKPKSFLNDSSTILRIEIVKELRQFKEYYRLAESMNKFKLRKPSFSIGFDTRHAVSSQLFYGKRGIIRLTSVLLTRVDPTNFNGLSTLNEGIFPYLNSLKTLDENFNNYLIVKLFYSIKFETKYWDLKNIFNIFKELKDFRPEVDNFFHMFSGIIQKIMKVFPGVDKDLEDIGGKIKFITKALKGEVLSPITRVKSEYFDNKNPEVNKRLNKLKTTINDRFSNAPKYRRKYIKKNSQECQKVEI